MPRWFMKRKLKGFGYDTGYDAALIDADPAAGLAFGRRAFQALRSALGHGQPCRSVEIGGASLAPNSLAHA